MAIDVREVKTRRDLKTFIYLPEKIHRDHHNWVPPIYMDEWKYFDPKKNKAFGYCQTILFLAFREGRPVGRIMGIINTRFNEYRNEKLGRFGFLETWEDQEVVHALLARVEEWARGLGMIRIVGPYGFSDQDPEGFLIEGFEHRMTESVGMTSARAISMKRTITRGTTSSIVVCPRLLSAPILMYFLNLFPQTI